jgi:hypothetical protein
VAPSDQSPYPTRRAGALPDLAGSVEPGLLPGDRKSITIL